MQGERIVEIPALMGAVVLSARVIYFPVRHHSPACAWHVSRLVREMRPDAVLIEGPRDASPLIPLLLHAETRMPVAIHMTYVERRPNELPERHAAYYPLCDFSPELAAMRTAAELSIPAAFIDLSFAEMVRCRQQPPPAHAVSLQGERLLTHSHFLLETCRRAGARDADDLWDTLYEVDYEQVSTEQFMRNVMAYCAVARLGYGDAELAVEGCLAREAAMAAAIDSTTGRLLVVTGGFHTVALPRTKGSLPPNVPVAAADAQVVLMRYGFEQLDRLNGYSSGMPSPEFYQRHWERRDVAGLLVELARQCRRKNLPVSTADAVAALAQVRNLAQLRSHPRPSREDLLDGIRSVFIKGADDTEGVPVLALARKLLAGDRVGNVPPEAGLPPLVHDFRRTAARLRLKLDRVDASETTLDLYRKRSHRETSRFLHRLTFLDVPFARWVRGPDFVRGERLERIQEVWNYHWSPQTESTLIERSLYGSTVEEAAANRLLEHFHEAERAGQGRRADLATELVLHACRMGLHRHTQDLLDRLHGLIAEDGAFDSLAQAMENLLLLGVSREPLEAHHLSGIDELAAAAYDRACYLLPDLATASEEQEPKLLDAMNTFYQAARTLGDTPDRQLLRWQGLEQLADATEGLASLRGAAVGLLHGDGHFSDDDLIRRLRGHLLGSKGDGAGATDFLRGLLRAARHVLWQVPGVIEAINELLKTWSEEQFVKLLPLLRLALSDLTPQECDRVAREVARLLGVERLTPPLLLDVPASEMLRGVELNRRVRESLVEDGLEAWG
ncbi:MAG TPA: DUF5682 family protein [Pirellulales bacterium]|nr:DUF5682 family protein [Pirellulales bacterium]